MRLGYCHFYVRDDDNHGTSPSEKQSRRRGRFVPPDRSHALAVNWTVSRFRSAHWTFAFCRILYLRHHFPAHCPVRSRDCFCSPDSVKFYIIAVHGTAQSFYGSQHPGRFFHRQKTTSKNEKNRTNRSFSRTLFRFCILHFHYYLRGYNCSFIYTGNRGEGNGSPSPVFCRPVSAIRCSTGKLLRSAAWMQRYQNTYVTDDLRLLGNRASCGLRNWYHGFNLHETWR